MAWHGITTTTTHTTMYIIKSVFPLCILEQLYTLSIGLDDAGSNTTNIYYHRHTSFGFLDLTDYLPNPMLSKSYY